MKGLRKRGQDGFKGKSGFPEGRVKLKKPRFPNGFASCNLDMATAGLHIQPCRAQPGKRAAVKIPDRGP